MGKIGWTIGTVELPSSHVFLTAAYGRRHRTVALPRWAVPAAAVLTLAALLWGLGATAYVLGHDTLLAAAMRHERDMQYGYEEKIAGLQRRLERVTTERAQLEEHRVEQELSLQVPTRAEMREVESSSALYRENHATFVTVRAVLRDPEEQPRLTSITLVRTDRVLVTVRYGTPKAFQEFVSRVDAPAAWCKHQHTEEYEDHTKAENEMDALRILILNRNRSVFFIQFKYKWE